MLRESAMIFLHRTQQQPQTERAWQRAVIEYAAQMGWAHWHDNARGVRQNCPRCRPPSPLPAGLVGWPDLWLARPPRLVVAELKGERGRLTASQRSWLAVLGVCPGIEVYVWRPSDWPEVEIALR